MAKTKWRGLQIGQDTTGYEIYYLTPRGKRVTIARTSPDCSEVMVTIEPKPTEDRRPKATAPQARSATHELRRMIAQNPSLSLKQLIREFRKRSYKLTTTTIASHRQRMTVDMKVLRELGMLR